MEVWGSVEGVVVKNLQYTPKVYTLAKSFSMKILSLKLDEEIFSETDKLTAILKVARNRYINDALRIYNKFNKRRLLKKQLQKESALTRKDSMHILAEFEKLIDDDQAV